MTPGAKTGRGPALDVGSSTVWGFWGVEADELLKPLEAEVPEDISNEDPKDPGEIRRDKERGVAGDQIRGMRQKKMEEKRPLNGKKKDKGSGTNLDRSEGCRGARTGMTRRMPRAKEDAKEGQGSRRKDGHR